ncbi:EAL domain-containing protein [Lachnospiraceae bacterium NSJ-143]|nr:EAL domain-containing protein [Lachnospiraceae bacterium NSJ-143]
MFYNASITKRLQNSKKLGVQVVAEGIETHEQLEFLKNVGCDYIQGYIYSKPLPVPEFEEWENLR